MAAMSILLLSEAYSLPKKLKTVLQTNVKAYICSFTQLVVTTVNSMEFKQILKVASPWSWSSEIKCYKHKFEILLNLQKKCPKCYSFLYEMKIIRKWKQKHCIICSCICNCLIVNLQQDCLSDKFGCYWLAWHQTKNHNKRITLHTLFNYTIEHYFIGQWTVFKYFVFH